MANFKIINFKYGEQQCLHFYFYNDKCIYTVNRIKGDSTYLNCTETNCPCKAKIQGDIMIRTNQDIVHHHDDHQFKAEFEEQYHKLKLAVESSSLSVQELHKASIRWMSRQAAGLMAWQNVRGTLLRIRRQIMPPCTNFAELDFMMDNNKLVYETYGVIRGKAFFNGSVNGQMIFSHPKLIPALEEGFELFVDATFKVTPFYQRRHQLLVVMATILGKPRPIIYAIMMNKSEENYKEIFDFIKNVVFRFHKCFHTPIAATTDFEMALKNAIKHTWPGIQTFGCNFHFCQALHRNAKLTGLSTKIKDNSEHHKTLRMFMRISLLPIEFVERGINSLIAYIESNHILAKDFKIFIEYFRKTWTLLYPFREWCVSTGRYRTNNSLEGYNSKIKKWIPLRPTPWQFLDGLLDLAYNADSDFENARNRNEILHDEDLSRLTPELKICVPQLLNGNINEMEFLRRMAGCGVWENFEDADG